MFCSMDYCRLSTGIDYYVVSTMMVYIEVYIEELWKQATHIYGLKGRVAKEGGGTVA